MDNSKNASASKAVGAVALGVLAGTALGVLFAPNKGSKTRKKIAGNATKMAKDVKKKVTDEVKSLKKKAIKLEKKAENILTDFKNGVEENATNLEKKVHDKLSDFKNSSDHKASDLVHDK